jgi:hypothetical protein
LHPGVNNIQRQKLNKVRKDEQSKMFSNRIQIKATNITMVLNTIIQTHVWIQTSVVIMLRNAREFKIA